jgi:endonuclease/exonuclease/phosphatase family metal-dependent hydrolase
MFRTKPGRRRALPRAAALCALVCGSGCAGNYALVSRAPGADGLAWFVPAATRDQLTLDRWRRGVGPAYLAPAAPPAGHGVQEIVVVSWNTAVGEGDVLALLHQIRTERGADAPLILLLQEVYRAGTDVPGLLDHDAMFAGRLGAAPGSHRRRDDIAAIAARARLNVYYAPSMRNGSPASSDEDRGNAILSSLPLSRLAAIELPFERQRRVAVAATVEGMSQAGRRWTLRVVSAHLDNVAGRGRLWMLGSGSARKRQARALLTYLNDTMPTVLAGDFNTWFGFADRTYRETARAFHAPDPDDRRATFRGLLRLDHVFTRLPEGWRARSERGDSRFGSDHYPLITTLALD